MENKNVYLKPTEIAGDSVSLVNLNNYNPKEFCEYYLENKSTIENDLLQYGVIKFKGVLIRNSEDFQQIVDEISDNFMAYVDGTSPRTKISGNVYTSTEYNHTKKIALHNELSYSAKWPGKLFFSCLKPAASGGETLFGNSAAILREMNPKIVKEVEEKGVMYIRNLHGGIGLGPSWQDTFEITKKEELIDYCQRYNIQLEWKEDNAVRLSQVRKGIIEHRKTGEKLWFNQIDQFHAIQLGDEMFDMMKDIYEEVDNFPQHVKYGNGEQISIETVKEIISTMERMTFAPQWAENEFVMVDNELVCHGRNPYEGEREVILSMSE
ncbi:MAG: TauD/TfdA family dioxygenase [Fluviicola sp.]